MALSPRYEGYAGYLLERMVLTLSNSDASVARDRGTCRPNMPPGDRSLPFPVSESGDPPLWCDPTARPVLYLTHFGHSRLPHDQSL